MQPPDKYIKTASDKQALELGYYWNQEDGDKVCNWLAKHCTFRTGPLAGKPFQVSRFQREEIIYPTYCWKRPNGLRRFNRVLVTTGKQSAGKTSLAGNLGLYHLLADGEPSPLCVLAAVNREQASELYSEAAFSVRANQHGMDERLKLTDSHYRMVDTIDKSTQLRTLSKDAPSKGGWKISYACFDEAALSANSQLFDFIKGNGVSRRQPLMFFLSNAGWDKSHWYYQQLYTPAKKILSGDSLDPHTLPVIWECPEDCNWRDKSILPMANPHLAEGLMNLDNFEPQYQDALNSKAGEIWWRRFICNSYVATETTWIDLDAWDGLKGNFPPLRNLECHLGIDLSSTEDLTSIAALYIVKGKYYVKSYNYIPQAALAKRGKQNLRDYQQFISDGSAKLTEGDAVDYQAIMDAVKKIPGKIKTISFDMQFQGAAVAQWLQKDGYECLNFPQTEAYYNEPCKKLDQLIASKSLVHDGSLCLRWCVNNASLHTNSKGLVKPKKSSDAMKIDAMAAMLMAIRQGMIAEPNPAFKSCYEASGLFA